MRLTDKDLLEEELSKHLGLISPQLELLTVLGTTVWSMTLLDNGESGYSSFLIPKRKDKRNVEERTRREKLRDTNAFLSCEFRVTKPENVKAELEQAQAEFMPVYARWLRGEDEEPIVRER